MGFAIPTSFLLCFALLAVMGVAISNIVMFGLILAVGMLVDGAIVVVEYADKRIAEGEGPMHAYVSAAKRMFWPVVSSTATTLCAFLPMLFWPGVPGQFMGMLPVTLIFVLSASLLVALVYLPVLGGVTGRLERWFDSRITRSPAFWLWHLHAFPGAGAIYLAAPARPRRCCWIRCRAVRRNGRRPTSSARSCRRWPRCSGCCWRCGPSGAGRRAAVVTCCWR